MKIIEKLWDNYWNVACKSIHGRAPEVQVTEMKKCFYAGAWAMFHCLSEMSDELTEDQACEMLSSIEPEMTEFTTALYGKPNLS